MARKTYPNRLVKKTRKNNSPWDRVLKYLSYRARSEKEIRDYLAEECTEEIIARLKELKFLDDTEFARMYIEQRIKFRPRSSKLIELELKRKGIDSSNIKVQTSNLNDSDLAKNALAKKLKLWSKLPYLEYKEKAVRFLAARGFSWDTIEKIVKSEYNEANVN